MGINIMEKRYKLGIIGFGGMAYGHYKSVSEHPEERVDCKGVFDLNSERMELAKKEGLVAYPSREALLSDPEIDIVLCAATNEVHKEICIDALRHGKHVICEKPVTITSEELLEVMEVAKQCGKVFTIDQNRRTNKDFVLMKRNVENGLIGKPYLIESRVEGSRGMPKGWRTLKELGGGMMLDWGVHLIDQLMYMNKSKVTSVYCKMFSIDYKEVDDNFHLTMEFADGLTAIIEVATNNYVTHPRWYAYGTDGSLKIDSWDCNGELVRVVDKQNQWDEEIFYTKAGPTKTMAPRHPDTVERIELTEPMDVEDTLEVVYRQLVAAIEGAQLKIRPEEALRVIKVMEAAFCSAEQNAVVKTDI